MVRRVERTRRNLGAVRRATLGETVEPATRFDPRLPGAAVPRGESRFRLSEAEPIPYSGDPETLAFATATGFARLVRARRLLHGAHADAPGAAEGFGPRLNCVVTLTEELALRQAAQADREIAAGRYRGPLHGIPWGASDHLATWGIRTTWGIRPYEHQVFDYDATVVRRLEEAGAVLVAKPLLGELAMGTCGSAGARATRGGPSADRAARRRGGSATAAGLVGFSIGSETLGSIVSPRWRTASRACVRLTGRVSRYGAMSLAWTLDKLGPMCRGVEDCAAVLSAIFGPDGGTPPWRTSRSGGTPFRALLPPGRHRHRGLRGGGGGREAATGTRGRWKRAARAGDHAPARHPASGNRGLPRPGGNDH